jgi:hypothetical protein
MANSVLLHVVLGMMFLAAPAAPPQGSDKDDRSLKAEAARQALIELVESSKDEPIKLSLPVLKNGKIVSVGDSEITIGKWSCNLAKKTFVLSLASDAGLFEISGVFEQAKDQKWRAKITVKKQT